MSLRHLVACAGASLLASTAASAESIGVLAVSEPPGPGGELVEVTAQFRAVLAEKTPGVLDAAAIRERMTGQTSTASLAELDRAYAGALATYQSGDFEGAIRTLRAVVEDLERRPDSPEAFGQWSRAMLRLARAEQTLGRRGEADAVLERLLRADPRTKVDPNQYPPSFARQVDEVRARLKTMKTRKLTVMAQKGVRVFVDGRDVGPAPVTVDLGAGRHRVSGLHDGLRIPSVSADLSSEDQTVELDLRLAEALRPGAGPGLALPEADRARRIVTTGAWLGLDSAVALSLVQDADVTFLVATLYDVRRGATHREGRLRLVGKAPPPGGLNALATFLVTGQPSSLVVAADPAAPTPVSLSVAPPKAGAPVLPELSRGGPPRTKALGWAAVATGVVTVAATGVAVWQKLESDGAYDDARAMLGPNGVVLPQYSVAQYNAKVSDGDSARGIAIGAGVGAGVALASTAVLGYLSYRWTGEIGPFRF